MLLDVECTEPIAVVTGFLTSYLLEPVNRERAAIIVRPSCSCNSARQQCKLFSYSYIRHSSYVTEYCMWLKCVSWQTIS